MYISIEDIQEHRDKIRDNFAPLHRAVIDAFVYSLETIQSAKVEPAKYGKWIPASTKPGVQIGMKCSECKARIRYSEYLNGQHLYCHKCGAKMIRGED